MWTRNSDVSNQNMLKHFIYLSFSKSTTSLLCSIYYRYSSKLSSFFCILSFLVRATSIDQTFYSATHYFAAVWLDFRHDLNINKFLMQTKSMRIVLYFMKQRLETKHNMKTSSWRIVEFRMKSYTKTVSYKSHSMNFCKWIWFVRCTINSQ